MDFLTDAEIVTRALDRYYRESAGRKKPVIHQERLEKIMEMLKLADYARDGGLTGGNLQKFLEAYLDVTTRLHHPAFLAHQVAAPDYSGALGSLVDGFTNNAMAIYEMGPGPTSIEYFVVNWMLQKVGWQPAPLDRGNGEHGGGILTHGGSLANLTALLMARNHAAPGSWQEGVRSDLALLAPAEAHYSVARAAGILGIGQRAIYTVEVDARGTILPDKLPATYARARREGRQPIAVVANACQTATGVYDPLDEIGDFARSAGLWFHVDGAHGASALLSDKHRRLMKGVEKADSLTWDAHKMLQAPVLCAALLVRDHHCLDAAFQQEASYLFHDKEQPGVDIAHHTVECTKAALGLRLFLVLGKLGERGLAAHVDRQCALAAEAYEYISRQPRFRCAVRPESNIVCFRVEGTDEDQLKIRDALNAAGTFYLSSTLFAGKRWLRMVFMSPQTSIADIEQLVREITRLG